VTLNVNDDDLIYLLPATANELTQSNLLLLVKLALYIIN